MHEKQRRWTRFELIRQARAHARETTRGDYNVQHQIFHWPPINQSCLDKSHALLMHSLSINISMRAAVCERTQHDVVYGINALEQARCCGAINYRGSVRDWENRERKNATVLKNGDQHRQHHTLTSCDQRTCQHCRQQERRADSHRPAAPETIHIIRLENMKTTAFKKFNENNYCNK